MSRDPEEIDYLALDLNDICYCQSDEGSPASPYCMRCGIPHQEGQCRR